MHEVGWCLSTWVPDAARGNLEGLRRVWVSARRGWGGAGAKRGDLAPPTPLT